MIEERWVHSWAEARETIKQNGGFSQFKSCLFKKVFRNAPYIGEGLVLLEGKHVLGTFTSQYIESSPKYRIKDMWYLADFDTAKGTSGYGRRLFETFLSHYGTPFFLGCWDKDAERFWRYMAKSHDLRARRIGSTRWGEAVLLFTSRQ